MILLWLATRGGGLNIVKGFVEVEKGSVSSQCGECLGLYRLGGDTEILQPREAWCGTVSEVVLRRKKRRRKVDIITKIQHIF